MILLLLSLLWYIYLFSKNEESLERVINIILFLSLCVIELILRIYLVKKGYYKTQQIIFFTIYMICLVGNMRFHLDVINTREPNPKKTLPYLLAVEHVFVLLVIFQALFLWYLQLAAILIYFGSIIVLLDDYEHAKYIPNIATLVLLLVVNADFCVQKNKVVSKFLKRLEENWKSILDNFQEGIIIFNKDFKLLYKNNSMKSIFACRS